ncbi:L-threonylcarbamoyladenylate synthase [Sphingomonas sp. 28-63-12]|uniref:L-threonylcarbamoyladenylate synthase n=1 Tax=Sphingomonas sp. 28-63-12 TaxID=1970434 RepID=UPI000BCDC69B|nr:MAG: threonylcarbamoyl-AMP synthase [Sphingomonas sp. 28-63-12]
MDAPNTALETRILPYSEPAIAEGARLILAGQPVAVPTETVYGLAADATDSAAVARIYAAKGRPSFNPLIVHVPDLAAVGAFAIVDDDARALAAAFWPGPLTLVLPLRPDSPIAGLVTAGLETIAVRVPQHRAMRALLAATGKPLAAPSANASGAISPTRAAHVLASLGGRIPLIINDGATPAGIESTIIMPSRVAGEPPRLLRPGPIGVAAIESVLGQSLAGAGDAIIAPGQLASHYAPRKPLRLNAVSAAPDEWLIGFAAVGGDDSLSPAGDLVEAATHLFEALHRGDASPKARIAIAPVPNDGLGVAINDRLARAATR